jgi:ribose transport system ATP-binding protein
MDRNALERDVRRALEAFDVRPPHPQLQFGHLSGGNQQKALLAKWLRLFGMARVLLLHEPTQGVDIAARQDIFRMIRESVATGATVLYVSTELEDLAHLCDRVIVVRHGQAVAEFARPHLTATALAVAALASQPQGAKEAISVDG